MWWAKWHPSSILSNQYLSSNSLIAKYNPGIRLWAIFSSQRHYSDLWIFGEDPGRLFYDHQSMWQHPFKCLESKCMLPFLIERVKRALKRVVTPSGLLRYHMSHLYILPIFPPQISLASYRYSETSNPLQQWTLTEMLSAVMYQMGWGGSIIPEGDWIFHGIHWNNIIRSGGTKGDKMFCDTPTHRKNWHISKKKSCTVVFVSSHH